RDAWPLTQPRSIRPGWSFPGQLHPPTTTGALAFRGRETGARVGMAPVGGAQADGPRMRLPSATRLRRARDASSATPKAALANEDRPLARRVRPDLAARRFAIPGQPYRLRHIASWRACSRPPDRPQEQPRPNLGC